MLIAAFLAVAQFAWLCVGMGTPIKQQFNLVKQQAFALLNRVVQKTQEAIRQVSAVPTIELYNVMMN